MPDLVNERESKLFHPETVGATVGAVWTYESRGAGGQWNTLSVAGGGTGATGLPVTPTQLVVDRTLLTTNGTAIAPVADATGSIGNRSGGGANLIMAGIGVSPYIWFDRANGTYAAPTATLAGNYLGALQFDGFSSAGQSASPRALIGVYAAENWTPTAQGARVTIEATPEGGIATTTQVQIGNGMFLGAATGGEKGVGTLNAVAVYANNVLLTSDLRLKEKIAPIPDGCLGLVEAIEPKSFRHKDESHDNWGFIAQEVAAAMPAGYGGHVTDAGGNQYLSPNDLVAVLWKAVRELSAEVAALKECAR